MSDEPKNTDDTRTVEGSRGDITDSSSLFTVDKGNTYKEFWSNVSTSWKDAVFSVVGTPFDRDATPDTLELSGEPEVQIIVDKLHIGPESSVLEIGSGVGRLAVHMAPRCAEYTGTDIAENMIRISVEASERHGLKNTRFLELSEDGSLPFDDDCFDAVYAQAVFIHLDREDCYRYMSETFRVLKPGGRAYFQFFNLLNDEGFRIFDWVSRHTVTPEGKVRGRVHFLTNEEVRQYARFAGFEIDESASHLETHRQDYPFPMPTINFDYYLVAIGRKPGEGNTSASLLDHEDRAQVEGFSDDYYRTCLGAFIDKVQRNNEKGIVDDLARFISGLEPELAFRTIIELELGAVALQNRKRDLSELIPLLYETADNTSDEPLFSRLRRAIEDLVR